MSSATVACVDCRFASPDTELAALYLQTVSQYLSRMCHFCWSSQTRDKSLSILAITAFGVQVCGKEATDGTDVNASQAAIESLRALRPDVHFGNPQGGFDNALFKAVDCIARKDVDFGAVVVFRCTPPDDAAVCSVKPSVLLAAPMPITVHCVDVAAFPSEGGAAGVGDGVGVYRHRCTPQPHHLASVLDAFLPELLGLVRAVDVELRWREHTHRDTDSELHVCAPISARASSMVSCRPPDLKRLLGARPDTVLVGLDVYEAPPRPALDGGTTVCTIDALMPCDAVDMQWICGQPALLTPLPPHPGKTASDRGSSQLQQLCAELLLTQSVVVLSASDLRLDALFEDTTFMPAPSQCLYIVFPATDAAPGPPQLCLRKLLAPDVLLSTFRLGTRTQPTPANTVPAGPSPIDIALQGVRRLGKTTLASLHEAVAAADRRGGIDGGAGALQAVSRLVHASPTQRIGLSQLRGNGCDANSATKPKRRRGEANHGAFQLHVKKV